MRGTSAGWLLALLPFYICFGVCYALYHTIRFIVLFISGVTPALENGSDSIAYAIHRYKRRREIKRWIIATRHLR